MNRLLQFSLFAIASVLLEGIVLEAADPDSIAFFENRIRPVLAKHCYECHSAEADEIGGSLLLDSSNGMLTGGDSGPVLERGDVDGSMLISAIRYESTEMPPGGRLPDEVIKDFELWVAAGAIDPRRGNGSAAAPRDKIDIDEGRRFWAFRPIGFATAPVIATGDSRGAIDQFIHARLQQSEVAANGLATPEVRLRRLAFDLTGLPPQPDLQRRWIAQPTNDHWRRIVDAMLASPEYGEHWARHWMDVARYADSNGADFNATHHEAWRYRDYLIRAYSEDRPFDEMIRQQIAGDLLPVESDDERYSNLVATTFLMLGTKMLSERDKAKLTLDVVDEQIDTVGRAFLGLTLGCARCHDHKFDPVPTEDYYALAGIFKSTITLNGESQKYVSTWNRAKLPTTDEHRTQWTAHQQAVKSLEAKLKSAEAEYEASQRATQNSLHAGTVVDDVDAEKTGQWKSSVYIKDFVGRGYVHDNNSDKGKASIKFTTQLEHAGRYEVRLSHSPGSTRASRVPVTIATAGGEETVFVNQRTVTIEPMWSSLGTFEFFGEADATVTISNEGTDGYVIADAVQFLRVDSDDSDVPPRSDEPTDASPAASKVDFAKAQVDLLKKALSELKRRAPRPLPESMAPADRSTDQIADSPVHVRGEVNNLGDVVPRGFVQVCTSGDSSIRDPLGSGRLELSDWLTDPDNPLVARVHVNRIWMHLMGEGLVRTVDNFGAQGDRPSHPQLLDELATEFVRGGWKVKPVIRRIVTSAAYNRSSDFNADSHAIDPENRLLWRMPRRRLPVESIRDAMIAATGKLDRGPRTEPMSGRGTLVSKNSGDETATFGDVSDSCRSIYLPVVRGYMPALLTALDVADPDLLVGKRPTTNVPSQALVLINSPDVNKWSRDTAERILDESVDFEDRLEMVFRICLQRAPCEEDLRIAAPVFDGQLESLDAWHEFIAAIFAGTEFRLLD